jgi:hypothetical protein
VLPTHEADVTLVVLGADHPLALPLILDLESQGYIVIASSESPERCDRLEAKCNGYVRALPLDPLDVSLLNKLSAHY